MFISFPGRCPQPGKMDPRRSARPRRKRHECRPHPQRRPPRMRVGAVPFPPGSAQPGKIRPDGLPGRTAGGNPGGPALRVQHKRRREPATTLARQKSVPGGAGPGWPIRTALEGGHVSEPWPQRLGYPDVIDTLYQLRATIRPCLLPGSSRFSVTDPSYHGAHGATGGSRPDIHPARHGPDRQLRTPASAPLADLMRSRNLQPLGLRHVLRRAGVRARKALEPTGHVTNPARPCLETFSLINGFPSLTFARPNIAKAKRKKDRPSQQPTPTQGTSNSLPPGPAQETARTTGLLPRFGRPGSWNRRPARTN